MIKNGLFTSESVSEGHPDKMSDQISDAILDAMLEQDKHSRVACETLVTTGLALIAGEITSNANIDFSAIVRKTIKEIGYDHTDKGFDYNTCSVQVALDKQSPDIAQGVNEGEGTHKEQGAGDQGMMFGYACDETPELMPASLVYSHKLVQDLATLRKDGTLPFLCPDSKAQVTVRYEDSKVTAIDTVVVSTQHTEDVSLDQLRQSIVENLINKSLPKDLLSKDTQIHINPTGRFVIGGPQGDCGLTGRKIIVDTYGGHGAHGGGAFSGKDPSKVDRSAAYMARYIAKNIVAAGYAKRALVQLAYAIGYPEPVSINVDTYGTGTVDETKLVEAVKKTFSTTPKGIVETLNLLQPIYRKTAAYGHFGRNEFPWEKTDKVDALKAIL